MASVTSTSFEYSWNTLQGPVYISMDGSRKINVAFSQNDTSFLIPQSNIRGIPEEATKSHQIFGRFLQTTYPVVRSVDNIGFVTVLGKLVGGGNAPSTESEASEEKEEISPAKTEEEKKEPEAKTSSAPNAIDTAVKAASIASIPVVSPVARGVDAANEALKSGGHRSSGEWFSQEDPHRTPSQWWNQEEPHRSIGEWFAGVPSRSKASSNEEEPQEKK